MQQKAKLVNWLLLVFVAFLFGSSFILIKRNLLYLNGMQVAAFRMAVAGVFFIPIIIRSFHKIKPKTIKYLIYVGIVGNALPSYLFAKAQTAIDSSLAGMLNTLTPLFTLIIGVAIFRARVRWLNIAGIILGLVGAIGLVYNGSTAYFSGTNWYALLGVLAIACISSSMNVVKYKLPGLRGHQVAALAFMFVLPLALGYLLLADSSYIHHAPVSFYVYPVLLGLTASFLPVTGINMLVQRTNPVFSSSVTYLIPIVAMLWGVADGEQIVLRQLVFIAVVLSGVFLVRQQ